MSQINVVDQTSKKREELPSWNEFVQKAGKEPSRYRELTTQASFILHHLATVAVAREQAPWLRALKDREFRKFIDELDLNDGKNRGVAMPEVIAHGGKLAHADLMAASDNFRQPLIVRGWFAGSEATKKWNLWAPSRSPAWSAIPRSSTKIASR
jgi:hypothetical protein